MDICLIPDAISSIGYATQSLTLSNSLLNRPQHNVLSLSDADQEKQTQTSPFYVVSASPPTKTLSRPRIRRTRRVKRKTLNCSDGEGNDFYFLDGEGCFGNFGSFGGDDGVGLGGSGGKGWNFGGYGGANWEEFSGKDDPAFDFVYGVLRWIAMSNCLFFAVKKVVKHGKLTVRLSAAC